MASTLRRAARKTKGRTWPELWDRAVQFVAAELEYRGLTSLVGEPSDTEFWRWVRPEIATAAGRDAARLDAHFRSRSPAALLAEPPSTGSYLQANCPESVAATIQAADRIRCGRFDLLGYTDLSFGNPIDWHIDPVNGARSPRRHWSRIRYLDPKVTGDHKVVWELNRHQHFMVLGRAYQATRREEYAATFADQVSSWMDENTPKQGVNWASSLEVAYRLIAWLWSLELFRAASSVTPPLRLRMLKYLHVHATHVERYLSTYFSPNTHLTGEALGLLYVGSVLPEFNRADRWARLGWAILTTELDRQVHADGVYFEQATHYQRYTADIYLHAVLLAKRNGWPVPQPVLDRLEALVEHLADLTRPDGSLPIVGDDDGGRVVSLEERECTDVRATLATAAVVYGRSKYAHLAGGVPQETVWLMGPTGAIDLERLRREPLTDGSRAYATGGYVIMRDGWHPAANHAVIDCGPHGAQSCGHSHADALAIDLAVHGCPLFVDPGTFTYTVSTTDRDHFRSSAAHNTLTVDGASSSIPAGPFSWESRTDARLDAWWASPSLDFFAGSHHGFERLVPGAVHERRVLFVRHGYWVIWDHVTAPAPHDVTVHLHAAPGTRVEQTSDRTAILERVHNGAQARAVLAAAGTIDRIAWETDWVSECYGKRALAPACRISTTRAGRRDVICVVVPAVLPDAVTIQSVEVAGGYLVTIERPESVDLVAIRVADGILSTSLSTDAEMAWMRRDGRHGPVSSAAVINGQSLRSAGVEIDLPQATRIELREDSGAWRNAASSGFAAAGRHSMIAPSSER
jgi:hypothetical protein